MNKKIFNNFVAGLVLVLLLTATVVKIHSFLFFPKINNRNYYQLQKIGKAKNEFSFAVFGDNKNSITTTLKLI